MRQLVLSLGILALSASSGAAGDLLARMDRVECMGEGMVASSTMLVRLSQLKRDDALKSAKTARHAELIQAAYDEPRRPNPEIQAKVFADRAIRACHSRLFLERQTALRERVRVRSARRKALLGW